MDIIREFLSTKQFDEQWNSLGLSDNDLRNLQTMLLENPKTGSVIRGTGRLRKMRFNYGNRGKSHCARVCYVDFEFHGKTYLIMVYAKNEMENLTQAERNNIKKFIERIEQSMQ